MKNFDFNWKTKIIFGQGTETRVGEETALLGKRALVLYGGGSVCRSGLLDRVTDSLRQAGVEYVKLGGVQPNPRLDFVYDAISLSRKEAVDVIVAVGGGSVIDTAKAIAIGVVYDGDIWTLFETEGRVAAALPVGAIPTLPATGTEASPHTVIKNLQVGLKRNVCSDLIRPAFAILNPELTMSLSPRQTACGVSDMFSHVMERYFAPEDHVELTDRLCEGTMKTIIRNGLKLMINPQDYHARAEIFWCGTLAHNDLLHTGRTFDFASHKLDHEINALCDCTHGESISIIMLAWCKYVSQKKPEKFVQLATNVFNVDMNPEDPQWVIDEGLRMLERFYRDLGLATNLRQLGIKEDDLETAVKQCKTYAEDKVGAYYRIDRKDMLEILKLAY